MGKVDRPRRLTRAEKIEQDRLERLELKRFQAKPWWPVKAETEDEAIKDIAERMDRVDQDREKAASKPMKDFRLLASIGEQEAFLKEVPAKYLEAGTNRLISILSLEHDDDIGIEQNESEEDTFAQYRAKLQRLGVEQLRNELNWQSDRQGAAGQMDPINESMAANAASKLKLVASELMQREIPTFSLDEVLNASEQTA